MSTIICLRHDDAVILAADGRFMKADFSDVATDSARKIFELSSGAFLAPSGWAAVCDHQLETARKLASETTDVRALANALKQETTRYVAGFLDILRSIQHLHEKIRRGLAGELTLHASVLVGRNAAGKLGYVSQVFKVQAGSVVCESAEYFGDEWKLYTTSGPPAQQAVAEDPTILTGEPVESVRKLLAGLKRVCPTIGGDCQIVRIDGAGAHWITKPPTETDTAGRGLEIAEALFAGDCSFARNGGGKVTINSAGIALADNLLVPTATVTVTATGITVQKSSNSVQVNASGVGIYGPNGSIVATSSGIEIASPGGANKVTVSSTDVRLTNATMILTFNGGTSVINIDSGNYFRLYDASSSAICRMVPGSIEVIGISDSKQAALQSSAGMGLLRLRNGDASTTVEYMPATYATANAGGATLPSNPVGFVAIKINGINYKIPYYAS